MKTADHESARDAMVVIMDRLKQAVESLDVAGVLALCRSSEEFLGVIDGVIVNYDQFVANEQVLNRLVQVNVTFDPLHIRVLGEDTVAALALFHQMIMDENHVVIHLKGEVTWIANRVNGGPWKLTYVHARHMPDTPD
jgi:hypothetical protein